VRAGVALRAVVFQLTVGTRVAFRAEEFQLAVRTGVALRADVFQLPMGAGVAVHAPVFPLAVGTRVAFRAVAIPLAVRAGVALRAVAFLLAVGVGAAVREAAFQLPMGTRGALRTVAFQLTMRTRGAHRTVAFLLTMRTPFTLHHPRCRAPRFRRSCQPTAVGCDGSYVMLLFFRRFDILTSLFSTISHIGGRVGVAMQRPGERGWFGSGGDTGAAVGHVCETGDLPTTVVDDDASAETAGTTAEPTAETRHTTNPRPSVSAAQASYLDAVSSAIASMPPETLSKSIEYVLAPVLRVMRLETDALGVLISGTTDGSSVAQEPPARRAERLNALESSVRCVCTCVRTAGSCGTTPETAVEVFFMLIVCLGHVATADGLAGSENWNAAKEKNGDGPHFENSQAAFETLKVVVLDAMMACLATYTTGNASVLISLINQTNLPKVGYLISLLLATAKVRAFPNHRVPPPGSARLLFPVYSYW